MDLETEIDRVYGVPLDEFVGERDKLAKRLKADGEPEASERVKALRKPTVGAWALNQAVRRRRAETDALLGTGERLRAAHEELLSGGDVGALRETMQEERSLTSVIADCAEVIASENGKSGPALRDRVRATLHAATVDEEARDELAAGRFVRERTAVGLGAFGAADAPAPARKAPARKRGKGAEQAAPKIKRPAPAKQADKQADKRAEREAAARAKELAEAESVAAVAQQAFAQAEAEHTAASEALGAAKQALEQAELEERETRRTMREHERELAKQERRVERLRPKR